MAAVRAGTRCTITPVRPLGDAHGDCRVAASRASLRRRCLTGPSTTTAFSPMSSRSSCRRCSAGDVVVLDNLAVHQQPEVRAAIEAVGASSGFCRPTARFRSHRTGVCETESVPPRRATTDLRSGLRARRGRARPSSRPPNAELRPALAATDSLYSCEKRSSQGHLGGSRAASPIRIERECRRTMTSHHRRRTSRQRSIRAVIN